MQPDSNTIEVRIAARGFLRLRDARGCTVRVADGQVWVTEEGDSRDSLLTPNARYCVARDGLTLVQAFREARVTVYPPQSASRRIELGTAPARSGGRAPAAAAAV